ncbi:MAG: hypothetical protein V4596_11515 [Bdellovibrionota bacterium]
MFKVLFAFILVGSIQSQAVLIKKIPAEIIGAAYVDMNGLKTIAVNTKYQGGCGPEKATLNVKKCVSIGEKTYSCVSDLAISSVVNQSCISKSVEKVFTITQAQIKNESLMSEKYKDSTLVIRGKSKEVEIKLGKM